jgi:hypothetical protein
MGRVKYGVPVPSSVQDAYTHDQRNGDNLGEKAIREEVQTIIDYGTFKFLSQGKIHLRDTRKHIYALSLKSSKTCKGR